MQNTESSTINVNSNNLISAATFVQEDNATLTLELYKNGQSVDLSGQTLVLGAERPDGAIIEQTDNISTNGNIVTIKLKKNILECNGLVNIQLSITDSSGTMSTTSFNITVDKKILGAECIKGSNDIETINSLVLELQTNVNKAITDTKNKADTLLSGLEDKANTIEHKVDRLTDSSNGLITTLTNLSNKASDINEKLNNNIDKAPTINSELVKNTESAKTINANLVSTNNEATTKNTELQSSLKETKEFINNLDESQNIPQLRDDIDKLQSGMKTNQNLSYTGSSIVAKNTLEGRTEGMSIGGRTLVNLVGEKQYHIGGQWTGEKFIVNGVLDGNGYQIDFDGSLLKSGETYLVGCYLENLNDIAINSQVSFGVLDETNASWNTIRVIDNPKNGWNILGITVNSAYTIGRIRFRNSQPIPSSNEKCTVTLSKFIYIKKENNNWFVQNPSYFTGIKSFGEEEKVGDKFKISILSGDLSEIVFKQGTMDSNTGNEVDAHNRIRSEFITGVINNLKISNLDLNSFRTLIFCYDINKTFLGTTTPSWVDEINTEYKTNTVYIRILVKYYGDQNITPSSIENVTFGNQDKKDILIKEPLRENDVMYEDNGQVKIDRETIQKAFTGDENNWFLQSINSYGIANFGIPILKFKTSNGSLSNLFKAQTTVIADTKSEGYMLTGSNDTLYIRINSTKADTLEKFKTLLKKWNTEGNPLSLVYQLAKPITEIVDGMVDIDLDTYQDVTYVNIENSLPGTLDFKVASNLGSMVQNMAKEVNNIWDVINELLVPNILKANGNLAMVKLNNNLK